MKKNNVKNSSDRNWKKILLIIGLSLLFIFIVLVLVNLSLREEYILEGEQKETLNKIFPEDHINEISFYVGGLIPIGSTKVLCDSVYFNKQDLPIENGLLVHEVTHTYQARKSCLKMSVSSLYHQFIAYVNLGSRNYAYFYLINQSVSFWNPEQEASIVEDYFLFNFRNYSSDFLDFCINCDMYSEEDLRILYEEKTKEIILEYR